MSEKKIRIRLRALEDSDAVQTHLWHNQLEIRDLYLGHPFPVSLGNEREFIAGAQKSNIPTSIFGIELIETRTLIGLAILKKINMIHRQAELAIYLGDEENRGKGYASEAVESLCDFGFRSLGLHRIWLEVRTDNTAAVRLYERCGFDVEGELRDAVYKNGRFYNALIMSRLSQPEH